MVHSNKMYNFKCWFIYVFSSYQNKKVPFANYLFCNVKRTIWSLNLDLKNIGLYQIFPPTGPLCGRLVWPELTYRKVLLHSYLLRENNFFVQARKNIARKPSHKKKISPVKVAKEKCLKKTTKVLCKILRSE